MGDDKNVEQIEVRTDKNNRNSKSRKKWIALIIILLLITNTCTFFVANIVSFKGPNGKVIISRDLYDDILKFRKLFLVRNKLYEYYDGPIDDKVLVESAVKGMTESLKDPYTVFMNEKEFENFSTQTEGVYVGLGIQVGVKDNKIIVIAPFDESPAKKAGIIPGDIIQKVNGIQVTGKELEKAVAMMKGKKGGEVTVQIVRGKQTPFDVKMTREEIKMITVRSEMLEDKIGYVRVSMFDENTADSFSKKIAELQKQGMKSLMIDLRENPGGMLDQCVDMLSNFIPKGKTIVYTIDKNKNRKDYNSTGGNAINLPITLLTDEGSASASEIFAGAIRDYKIGTLVGEKTFGKGVVQTIFYRGVDGFGDGTSLKVTVSKYYAPNGENINHKGIEPNIKVKYPDVLRTKPYNRNEDPQFKKAVEVAKSKIK